MTTVGLILSLVTGRRAISVVSEFEMIYAGS